jgi:copper chaperone CopZ
MSEEKLFNTLRKMTLTPDTVTNVEMCEQYKYIGGSSESGQKFFSHFALEKYPEPVLPEYCPCGKGGIKHWEYIYHPANKISIAIGSSCIKKFLTGINRTCNNADCDNQISSNATSPYCKSCLKNEGVETILKKARKLIADGITDVEEIRNALGLTKYEQYIYDMHVELCLSRIRKQIRDVEEQKRRDLIQSQKVKKSLEQQKLAEECRIREELERKKLDEEYRIHQENEYKAYEIRRDIESKRLENIRLAQNANYLEMRKKEKAKNETIQKEKAKNETIRKEKEKQALYAKIELKKKQKRKHY